MSPIRPLRDVPVPCVPVSPFLSAYLPSHLITAPSVEITPIEDPNRDNRPWVEGPVPHVQVSPFMTSLTSNILIDTQAYRRGNANNTKSNNGRPLECGC